MGNKHYYSTIIINGEQDWMNHEVYKQEKFKEQSNSKSEISEFFPTLIISSTLLYIFLYKFLFIVEGLDWKCTEEAMIHLMPSSWLCWDWPDLSLSTTNVPIKNLSILQQIHINHSLSMSPDADVLRIGTRPPVFPCAKLKLGFTVESLTHFLNGLFLTRAYGPYIWAECYKQASKCHDCYRHLLCNIWRALA